MEQGSAGSPLIALQCGTKTVSASQIKGDTVLLAYRWRYDCVCVPPRAFHKKAPYTHRCFRSSQQTSDTNITHTPVHVDITVHTWINITIWACACCLYQIVSKTNMSSCLCVSWWLILLARGHWLKFNPLLCYFRWILSKCWIWWINFCMSGPQNILNFWVFLCFWVCTF